MKEWALHGWLGGDGYGHRLQPDRGPFLRYDVEEVVRVGCKGRQEVIRPSVSKVEPPIGQPGRVVLRIEPSQVGLRLRHHPAGFPHLVPVRRVGRVAEVEHGGGHDLARIIKERDPARVDPSLGEIEDEPPARFGSVRHHVDIQTDPDRAPDERHRVEALGIRVRSGELGVEVDPTRQGDRVESVELVSTPENRRQVLAENHHIERVGACGYTGEHLVGGLVEQLLDVHRVAPLEAVDDVRRHLPGAAEQHHLAVDLPGRADRGRHFLGLVGSETASHQRGDEQHHNCPAPPPDRPENAKIAPAKNGVSAPGPPPPPPFLFGAWSAMPG